MRLDDKTVIDHPVNAGLRRYFEPRFQRKDMPCLASPEDVSHPYYTLGTHPDIVARLWDELGKILPADSRAIFFGIPALIHPETGIVFGFAGGTHTYALRLPEAQRFEAIGVGAKPVKHYPRHPSFDLNEIGEAWLFCSWYKNEEGWCLAAYEYAGSA